MATLWLYVTSLQQNVSSYTGTCNYGNGNKLQYFSDTRRCLRYLAFYGIDTHFVFIGDSRIREQYLSFVRQLQLQDETATEPPERVDMNLSHNEPKLKVRVDYIWSSDISTNMVENFRYLQ